MEGVGASCLSNEGGGEKEGDHMGSKIEGVGTGKKTLGRGSLAI